MRLPTIPSTTLPTTVAAALLLVLLPAPTRATFECKKVLAGGAEWNLSKLGGLHQVSWLRDSPSGELVQNTTFKISLCGNLEYANAAERQGCGGMGTRICGVDGDIKDGELAVRDYIPIAREDLTSGAHFDAKRTRLKGSDSHTDSQKEGLRLRLGGGTYEKRKQEALIEFLCLRDGDGKARRRRRLMARDDDDDKKDDDKDKDKDKDGDDDGKKEEKPEWAAARKADDGVGGEITFLSYDEDQLRLEWHTPFGCEDAVKGGGGGSDDDGGDSSGGAGWGFFSWFFFLAFIGLLLYFGFSAWLNYSRYGAHGWDLIPHADTIRDIPYILGDWWRKIVGTISGGGSRGGYSAV